MPKLYMLIGVPGSGKSTWIKDQIWALGLNIISTDVWIDDYAKRMGKTYSEVFEEYIPTATKFMEDQVVFCREHNLDVIWDQTNMSAKSRAKKLAKLPGYEKIAVVFRTPEKAELDRRLASRPGKFISESIINSMIKSYDEPTEDEGFKEIWRVQ